MGWGAFLACSWTWCIGMFLPVLLMRDFGPWSFVLFAAPNVVGAAAMGWVLRHPGASAAVVERHRGACEAFSVVTRAFQYFFLVWMLLGLNSLTPGLVALGAFLVGSLLGSRSYRSAMRAGIGGLAMLAVSIGLMAGAALLGGLRVALPESPSGVPGQADLTWLAPVVAFGFLLCPYLDLSFHHARQHTTEPLGTRAFLLGFGVMFVTLIAATPLYAWMFLAGPTLFGSDQFRGAAGVLVLCHIAGQLGYTIEVHRARAAEDSSGRVVPASGFGWGGLGIVAGVSTAFLPAVAGLESGEAIYRCFMAFYGLVFPAYVWICMIPGRDGPGLTRRTLLVWAIAIAVAAPLFWLGFVERVTWCLGPGLAAVLLARLAVRRPPPARDLA